MSPGSVRTVLDIITGTLAFFDVGGDAMEMKLPTELPRPVGGGRLLQDLRDVPDDKASDIG